MIKSFFSKAWYYLATCAALVAVFLRLRSNTRKDAVKGIKQEMQQADIDFKQKVQAHKDRIYEKVTSTNDDAKRDQLRKHSRTRNSK